MNKFIFPSFGTVNCDAVFDNLFAITKYKEVRNSDYKNPNKNSWIKEKNTIRHGLIPLRYFRVDKGDDESRLNMCGFSLQTIDLLFDH